MKQGSWQNEISGIIVKPFACTILVRDQGDRKPALQVTPITASQAFILSLFHHGTIIKKSNTSSCLLLGTTDELTWLDLDERAADMWVSTENHLKAFSASCSSAQETSEEFRVNTSFHTAPCQYFQRTSSGVSRVSQTWTFAFSSDLQRIICTCVVWGGTYI